MNPRLYILRTGNSRDYSDRKNIHFTVVDKDITKDYPSNFVCVLPQHMSPAIDDSSIFAKTFKETKLELAKKLLNQALKTEDDSEIKTEIRARLKLLEPKPILQQKYRHYH
jgi:hypothetical protein